MLQALSSKVLSFPYIKSISRKGFIGLVWSERLLLLRKAAFQTAHVAWLFPTADWLELLDHAFIFTSILCHEYPPNTKSHSWSTVFLCISASCERLSLVFSMSESCLEAGWLPTGSMNLPGHDCLSEVSISLVTIMIFIMVVIMTAPRRSPSAWTVWSLSP